MYPECRPTSVRRELLDRLLIINQRHAAVVLCQYEQHYNGHRPHHALGQATPLDAKVAWDPSGAKKSALRDAVAALIPDLEVRSGGSTSIDITHRGIDKAYGMTKLSEETGVAFDDMLFYGDRLDPDGNDYPVLALGVPCEAVEGWEDTAAHLDRLLPALPVRVWKRA